MSKFKLLAIMPLAGCSKKFRKSLKSGVPYPLYQNYTFTTNDQKTSIRKVSRIKGASNYENLYSLDNGIDLQISAIVGMNGSGKSTLFELLYYFIYVLGISKHNVQNSLISSTYEDIQKELKNLIRDHDYLVRKTIPKASRENYLDKEFKLERRVFGTDSDIHIALHFIQKYELNNLKNQNLNEIDDLLIAIREELFNRYSKILSKRTKRKQEEDAIRELLAVSIIYEKDDRFFEAKYYQEGFYFKEVGDTTHIENLQEFSLEDFFYTISVNYSHHGLNAQTIGPWINKLFHKNDAYRTPVVINPMRTNGNFDINDEILLLKARLMSNLVYEHIHNPNYLLLDKYYVERFVFSVKVPRRIRNKEDFLERFEYKELLNDFDWSQINDFNIFWDNALLYLEKKIHRIKQNYGFLFEAEEDPHEALINFLKTDKTHITKKVRQTLNFLKYTSDQHADSIWKTNHPQLVCQLTPTELLRWLSRCEIPYDEMSPSELMEYALPGFMEIDFKFQNAEDETQGFQKFSDLSSGEQQLLFNIQSVLYHLYNLDSVHEGNTTDDSMKRVAYKHINLLLDEMELYYHPEWQRSLIFELHRAINRLKPRKRSGIQAINVTILTHSPFIISDIPSTNILRLPLGENENPLNHTFAANIHDILYDNFFLDDALGKFAKEKINHLLENLDKINNGRKQPSEKFVSEAKALIRLIEEPVLKNKLTEMLHEIAPDPEFINEIIERETAYLRKLYNNK